MKEAKVNGMETMSNLPAKTDEVQRLPALEVEMYKMEVQAEHVRKYFAPKDATTADIGFFIAMANSLGLNPWKRELHLVPFYSREGGRKYAAVVGYEVYLNRAEASGKLDGWEYEFDDDLNPTKCTITVHRKDWGHAFRHTVYMSQVMRRTKADKPMAMWGIDPAHMLLKCTVTRTFRLCMPESCGALPYTAEEQLMVDPDQYQESQVQLSEATVTSAQVIDVDYLRGQYFKYGKAVWADEDARHKWNVDNGFPESTKGWLPIYWEKAVDILDPAVDAEPTEFYEAEEARLNDEVGADGGTVSTEDGSEDDATPTDGSEVEMESAEAIQGEISEKRRVAFNRIIDLVESTPFKTVRSVGFKSWRNQILPDEKSVDYGKLSLEDLNILIGELETRDDKHADEAAETNGKLC